MVRIAAPITAPRYTQNWVLNIQTPNLFFFQLSYSKTLEVH